jgi:psp operon transcriptional activator
MKQPTRLIGSSQATMDLLDQVSKVAPLNKPVLIVGERGTGKELIAERLHLLSQRWQQTYVKMNCAAISDSLVESELFGHESGSFTGAGKAHMGKFERADSGTLFLDELATLNYRVQEKLLRTIEYGEFERLGGSKTITSDIRFIGATNEDLPKLAGEGKFREDLLDRLSFDVITLPPLRARQDDILELAQSFAIKMSLELNWSVFPGFSDAVVNQLSEFHWPGNIRELKNVVERSVYHHGEEDQILDRIIFDPFESPYRLNQSIPSEAKPSIVSSDIISESFTDTVKAFEIQLIEQALEQFHNNQKLTAEHLGMTYHQLRGYLRKHDIETKRS